VVRRLIVGFAIVAVGAGAWYWWNARPLSQQGVYAIPGEGDDVLVEVLNGAGVDGLAAAMSRQLRRNGIDVVYYGTSRVDTFTTTQIVVRRGDTAGTGRIQEALGAGTVVIELDSQKLLDVTVILGRDVRPSPRRP
jgi:calcineurin-like phosphoesterase